MRKFFFHTVLTLFFLSLFVAPVYAQSEGAGVVEALSTKAIALAIAAAGCGYAQSQALSGGCQGVSRNPGAAGTIRFFIILGLAFIEFLALLVFIYVGFF